MVKFQWDTEAMSPNQCKIADYIEKNLRHVLLSTEQEISDVLEISIASVSRFWRSVGYKNFKDFKVQMRKQLDVSPASKMEHIMQQIEGQEPQHRNLELSVNHLQKTMEHFNQNSFQKVVDLLFNARRIYIHSPGPSQGLGELMKYRLNRFGLDLAILQKGGSELLEELLQFKKHDVVVIFGFIRMLPEAKVILNHAKKVGLKSIVITDQLVSDFTNSADVELFASRGEMWEFHSMIAPTFLVENIVISIGLKNKEENLQRLEELSQLRKVYGKELPR